MTDYATLQAEVAAWSAKKDLTAVIPSFIRIAEAHIARRVRVLQMQFNTQLVVPDTGSLALPAGFLGFRSVAIEVAEGLRQTPEINYLAPDVFHELVISSNQIRGIETDSYYTLEGNNILVSPEPGTGTTLTLNATYWKRFDALSDTNTTNWLLTNHFDVYLYATLAELWRYRMDIDQEQISRAIYQQAVNDLHTSERRKARSGPNIRHARFAP